MLRFYAHKLKDDSTQTVEEHLLGTKKLCGSFAAKFGCRRQGELIGLLHDIGKCSTEYQSYLDGGPFADHESAGALECARLEMDWAAECIVGHHSGLPDMGNPNLDTEESDTLCGRLARTGKRGVLPYYCSPVRPDFVQPPAGYGRNGFRDAFLLRMLFSCLIDADRLNIREFAEEKRIQLHELDAPERCLDRLDRSIRKADNPEAGLLYDTWRRKGREGSRGLYCLKSAAEDGQTEAALAFALMQLSRLDMKRIFFVLPDLSGLTERKELLKGCLEEDMLYVDAGEATNWDHPVILTTADRFFPALYSASPDECRRIHNLSNSVILLDAPRLSPELEPACAAAAAELTKTMNSTLLLLGDNAEKWNSLISGGCKAEPSGIVQFFENGINGCRLPFRMVEEQFRITWERACNHENT